MDGARVAAARNPSTQLLAANSARSSPCRAAPALSRLLLLPRDAACVEDASAWRPAWLEVYPRCGPHGAHDLSRTRGQPVSRVTPLTRADARHATLRVPLHPSSPARRLC